MPFQTQVLSLNLGSGWNSGQTIQNPCQEVWSEWRIQTIVHIILSKKEGHQLGNWQWRANLLSCFGFDLILCTGHQPRILKMAEFGDKSSLYELPIHSRSNLLNFYLRIEYHEGNCEGFSSEDLSIHSLSKFFCWPTFLSCCLLMISKIQGKFAILLTQK